MLFTKPAPADKKHIIYDLIDTLTELNPNIIEIRNPIERSNAVVKEAVLEIDQLNSKNKLMKLANLAVLEQKLPLLKASIDAFIEQLTTAKKDAVKLTKDYENVIRSLKAASDQIDETDHLKTDVLSIISLNNLKLKNIENQIAAADEQIKILERFKSITLYHLSDTINNNKENKEESLISDLCRLLKNSKKSIKLNVYMMVCFIFGAGYNYLASTYYYVSERVEKVELPTTAVEQLSSFADVADSVTNIVTSLCGAVSVFALIALLFGAMNRSMTIVGLATVTGLLSAFAPLLLNSLHENSSVTYVEKTITEYYEFLNFGLIGTIILIWLACLNLYFISLKHKRSAQISLLISKLEPRKETD